MKKHILIISTMILLSLAMILFSISTKYKNSFPSSKMVESPSLRVEKTQPSLQSSAPNSLLTAENTEVEAVDKNGNNEVMPEEEFPLAQGSLSNDDTSFIDDTNSYEQNETEQGAQERVTMNEESNTFEKNNTLMQVGLLERIIMEYGDPNTSPERRRELLELDEAITGPVRAPATLGRVRASGVRNLQIQQR